MLIKTADEVRKYSSRYTELIYFACFCKCLCESCCMCVCVCGYPAPLYGPVSIVSFVGQLYFRLR